MKNTIFHFPCRFVWAEVLSYGLSFLGLSSQSLFFMRWLSSWSKSFCIEFKLFLQTLSTNVKSSGSPPPSFSISEKLPNLRSPPWICPTSQRYHSLACIYVIFIYSLQKQHMYSILVSYHLFECCVVFSHHLEYLIMELILRKRFPIKLCAVWCSC